MMGGTISVESRKGKGSTFTVDLDFKPLSRDALEEIRAKHEDKNDFSLAGRRILFAEDVEINAEILCDLLELEDIETDWAKDGQIAVDTFLKSEPGYYDAIIMDMRMPVMDGIAAARIIRGLDREDAKTIPIIALTANAFYKDVCECLDAGMDVHLSKPVDADLLNDTLKKMIGRNA
jgi:CheY-like chemotaxis protein